MTNMQECEYRDFLARETWHGEPLTEKAINSRVVRARKVEDRLGASLEDIVASDERMRQALIHLRENDPRRNISNALRKYYKMRHGREFPQLRDVRPPKAMRQVEVAGDAFGDVLRRFHRWLIEEGELEKNSADQYKTYLKKLCAEVNGVFGPGWFESLPVDDLHGASTAKLDVCSAYIELGVATARGKEKKNWSNWRSAFRQYEEYLDEMANLEWLTPAPNKRLRPVTAEAVVDLKGAAGQFYVKEIKNNPDALIATYTHEELGRIFLSRLKTQSRYYPAINLLFPTRVLTKIFRGTKGNAWTKWLKDDIESMHLLTGTGQPSESFGNVKRIEIRHSGDVNVVLGDGSSFLLYTHTGKGRVVKMVATGARDISIDHVEPLEKVLRQKKDQLDGLKRLTDLIKAYKKAYAPALDERAEYTWYKDFFEQYKADLTSDTFRNQLKEDLRSLELTYELMGTRCNSSKGNRD